VPTDLHERRLVKRLLANDEQAFTHFFDENFGRLYRFALVRLGNDREAALEIVQTTLSKGIRNLRTYRGEAALFTWLCAICRNEISDWFRKQGRYRQHILLTEDLPEIQAAVDSYQMPAAEGPEGQFQRTEIIRLIQVALDRLPPRYGNVLEWKYIDGYSIKEIAVQLEMGQEATQSLLARAKRAFADVYGSLAAPVNSQSANTGSSNP